MITFRYKEESLGIGKKSIKRPIADVFLQTHQNRWLEFHPYIDSGADLTMIPLSLGKLIGLEAGAGTIEQIGGIKGSVPVIYARRTLRIGNLTFSATIAWALIEDVPPLLGRQDVFDSFDVTFKQRENKILFIPPSTS